jgi:DNA-directed RNA polymerase beta' subunit
MVDAEDQTEKVNSIFMMADSGARGSNQQMKQLAGYAWIDGEAFG